MSQIASQARDRRRMRGSITLIAALIAAAVSGCGSASPTTTTTNSAATNARSTRAPITKTTGATAPARATKSSHRTGPLAFSECMRANGVANFPDPSPGGGLGFKASPGVFSSPAFRSAQATCQRLLPGGPLGFQSNPSRRTMAKLLKIAECMRAHGIHQFPDPLYSRPKNFSLVPGEYQEITDFDGATLLFPKSMDLQAPAYRKALSACGAPPLGLPH